MPHHHVGVLVGSLAKTSLNRQIALAQLTGRDRTETALHQHRTVAGGGSDQRAVDRTEPDVIERGERHLGCLQCRTGLHHNLSRWRVDPHRIRRRTAARQTHIAQRVKCYFAATQAAIGALNQRAAVELHRAGGIQAGVQAPVEQQIALAGLNQQRQRAAG